MPVTYLLILNLYAANMFRAHGKIEPVLTVQSEGSVDDVALAIATPPLPPMPLSFLPSLFAFATFPEPLL